MHEDKLYHKHLIGLKAENERLAAENARINQEIEKFKGYLEAWGKDE
jgi:hypothetical protein